MDERQADRMKVVIFGATGMVGQGVLRECLLDPSVERVLCVGRTATGKQQPKLQELLQADLFDVASYAQRLQGYDACFFCLGVSSAGMTEQAYRRLTFELTLSIAKMLAAINPAMTFIYVSGAGTDSSEKGRTMWARVKGETENALLQLPFKCACMFRPGAIMPLHGITSKTRIYRILYFLMKPFWRSLLVAYPNSITTTEQVGRAMLRVARDGAPKRILESADIVALAQG